MDDKQQKQTNTTISAKIIKRIVDERRQRSNLAEDLEVIKTRMRAVKDLLPNKEDRKMEKVINVLINYHQFVYYLFVHGLDRVHEN